MDGELALSTGMALLEPLLPLPPAGSSRTDPAALRPAPLEEVNQTSNVFEDEVCEFAAE